MEENEIKKKVKENYAEVVKKRTCCCGPSSCCSSADARAAGMGYSKEEISDVPDGANLGLGCGNPTAMAELIEGETVLDLGSGAGIDAFLAARKVGKNGKVIGVDMTEEMIEKARENAKKGGYANVEFRLGEIENLPVDDDSVDVIISNCVVNLSPDKQKVYAEAYRVLKNNGRMLVSDIVTEGALPDDIRNDLDSWSKCVSGALDKNEYLSIIENTGFKNVRILSENAVEWKDLDERVSGKILSIRVEARKEM